MGSFLVGVTCSDIAPKLSFKILKIPPTVNLALFKVLPGSPRFSEVLQGSLARFPVLEHLDLWILEQL